VFYNRNCVTPVTANAKSAGDRGDRADLIEQTFNRHQLQELHSESWPQQDRNTVTLGWGAVCQQFASNHSSMAASDCVIDTVTRLQTLTGSHGKAPPDVWNHTCRQLLGLMNDYPGGVSTPVLETHLWSQSHAARVRTTAFAAVCGHHG